jgi:ligand-binding sensor domain-containing protein
MNYFMKQHTPFVGHHFFIWTLLIVFSVSCTAPPKKQSDPVPNTQRTIQQDIDTSTTNYDLQLLQPSTYEAPPLSMFVRRIFQDGNGNLWFGTNGDGVIRYNGTTIEQFSINEGFGGVAVRGIVEDTLGNLWFGTDSGLTQFDGTSFKNFTTQDGLAHNDIWTLKIDAAGLLWIGTYGGVSIFNGDGFSSFTLPETPVDHTRGVSSTKLVHDIMQDRSGNMWFATNKGAFVYDGTTLTNLSKKDGLANNIVNDLLEDSFGNIWFATHHKGVSRFTPTELRTPGQKAFINFTETGVIQGNEVWSLFEDSKKNIWFPAEGFGVYRYDGTQFRNYSTEHGLTSNAVQDIYEDKKGRIWLGGHMGLFRYEPSTTGANKKSIYRVTKSGPWPTDLH